MQATSKFTLRNALILTALVVPGGCVALLAISLARGAMNMCANKTVQETVSPDGQNRAVVFERDCGASTGFSAQVTIFAKDEAPGEGVAAGMFAADTNHGAAPAGAGGGSQVRVRWRSAGGLEIGHDARARVFRAKARFRGIFANYVKFPLAQNRNN